MGNKIVVNLLVILTVMATLTVCRKAFRLKASTHTPWPNFIDITKFSHFDKLSGLVVVVLMPCMGVVWYNFLQYVSLLQAYWFEETKYAKIVDSDVLLLMAFFLGFSSSIILQAFLYKLILRRKFEQYIYYSSQKVGFNILRANVAVSTIVLLLFMAIALLATNSYTRITSSDLVINNPFSLQEIHYLFSDIRSIKQISEIDQSEHNVVAKTFYVFDFMNGENWRTNSYEEGKFPEDLYNIILFASQASGKEVQNVNE